VLVLAKKGLDISSVDISGGMLTGPEICRKPGGAQCPLLAHSRCEPSIGPVRQLEGTTDQMRS
jgi:hypothetical protein